MVNGLMSAAMRYCNDGCIMMHRRRVNHSKDFWRIADPLRLAVEYPGYGLHSGTPNPESIEARKRDTPMYSNVCQLSWVL